MVRHMMSHSGNMKVVSGVPPVPEECRTCPLFVRPGNFCAQLDADELCKLSKHSRTLSLRRGQTLDGAMGAMQRSWPMLAVRGGVVGITHLLDDCRSPMSASASCWTASRLKVAMSITRLDSITAARELAAMAAAISATVDASCSRGTRWLIRPIRSASSASMVRAVKISSGR